MTQQLIDDVQSIQSLLGAIWSNENLKLSRDEVNKVGSIYKQISNGRRLNLQCSECVRNAISFIAVWWQENSPKPETTNKKKKV